MEVFVNSEIQQINADSTLISLLGNIGLAEKKGIAVAVNNKVITKKMWATHILQAQDKIAIITATQGG